MFGLMKLRPTHGWNAVSWELGIVILGVLMALGAQQAVEEIRSRQEVAQTREALDAELRFDVAAFDYRISQRPCISARLAELSTAAARQREGQLTHFKRPVTGPVGFGVRSAVWAAASGEARSRMPIDVKIQYAALHDFFRNFTSFRDAEETEWHVVEDADFGTRMASQDLQHVAGSIRRLEEQNALLLGFMAYRQTLAEPLHIEPEKAIDAIVVRQVQKNREALCTPYS